MEQKIFSNQDSDSFRVKNFGYCECACHLADCLLSFYSGDPSLTLLLVNSFFMETISCSAEEIFKMFESICFFKY